MHLNRHVARYAVLATRILLHQKQYPAALTQCERALALDPHASEAAALRRRCFEVLGIALAEIDEEAHDTDAPAALPPYPTDDDSDADADDADSDDACTRAAQTQIPLLFMLDVPPAVASSALSVLRMAVPETAPTAAGLSAPQARVACALAVFLLSGSERAPPLPRPAAEEAALTAGVRAAAAAGYAPARLLHARMLCYGIGCARSLAEALALVGGIATKERERKELEALLRETAEAAEALAHWEANRRLGVDGLAVWERVGRMDAGHVPEARVAQLVQLAEGYARDRAAGAPAAAAVDETTRAALEAVPRIVALYRSGSRAAADALAALHLAFDACQCAAAGRVLDGYARVRLARRVCDGLALPLAPLCAAYDAAAAAHSENADVRFFRVVFAAGLAPAEREALAHAAVRAEPHAADARHVHGALLAMLGRHERALREAEAAHRLDPSVPAYAYAVPAARMHTAATDAQARTCVAELEAFLARAPPDDRHAPDAHYNIARLLLGLRQPPADAAARARRHYRAAVAAAVQPSPRPFFFPPVAPAPALARIIDTLPPEAVGVGEDDSDK